MRYYELLYDYENAVNHVKCFTDDELEFDRYMLAEGKHISDWKPDFTFYYDLADGDIFTDYLSNDLAWLVISERFKQVLEAIGVKDVEFLPCKVENIKNSTVLDCYYVANLTAMVDALNMDHSVYSIFELDDEDEKVLSIKKYALNKSAVIDFHVFRVRHGEFAIFISETVKKGLESNGITGCDYYEVKVIE